MIVKLMYRNKQVSPYITRVSAKKPPKTIIYNNNDRSISATLSRNDCKLLSAQLSKISRMASKSARSVFDFFRLAFNLLSRSAASGSSN